MNILELLLKRLPLSQSELLLLIATAPHRYKVHTIDKRHNRGKRVIAQPTAEVKVVQEVLQSILREQLPVHPCVKSYQRGVSIKDHALPHADKSYLLKVDFKNFFPSILGEDFRRHLKLHRDFDDRSAKVFESIFFWRPRRDPKLRLSIGAPSSPWISNTILFEFDSMLSRYCHERDITYTRYADDLALSTNTPDILRDALEYIKTICDQIDYPRLVINPDKTVFTSKKRSRRLTGLTLANDGTVSIGRNRKREIRAMASQYSRGLLVPDQIANLRGLLAFTLSIDRDFNKSIERMIGTEKYITLMH